MRAGGGPCSCGALFLVAMTATYLSIHSFVATSSRYFAASWGELQWECQIRASASPRRPLGSAEGVGLSVLVTGAAGIVGASSSSVYRLNDRVPPRSRTTARLRLRLWPRLSPPRA